MLRIGVTGGIGSGKTTVSNAFNSTYNIPVIDADIISREVLSINGAAYRKVVDIFGSDAILRSGEINRKYLRKIIYSNTRLRSALEDIIHPEVRLVIADKIKIFSSKYCLIVVPLLIESNMQSSVDRILVVDTYKNHQLDRVSLRDQCSLSHSQKILDSQINAEERLRYAHDIITNNGKPGDLAPQINQLHQKYLSLSV